jgi:hypothetical protein
LHQALSIQKRHLGPRHFEVANTLILLSAAYGTANKIDLQRDHLEHALQIQEEYFGPEHVEVAFTLRALGEAAKGGEATPTRKQQSRTVRNAVAAKPKVNGSSSDDSNDEKDDAPPAAMSVDDSTKSRFYAGTDTAMRNINTVRRGGCRGRRGSSAAGRQTRTDKLLQTVLLGSICNEVIKTQL